MSRNMARLATAEPRTRRPDATVDVVPADRIATSGTGARRVPASREPEQLGRDDAYATLIPDGLYDVVFVDVERGWCWGREIAFLLFRITTPGEHFGLPIMRFANVPTSWRGKRVNAKARLARSSTLCRDWIAIRGTRPPGHVFGFQELYGGRVLLARVVQVRRSQGEGGPLEVPEAARYSKIERFVSPETAAPREGR